jgi:hypothetical protein
MTYALMSWFDLIFERKCALFFSFLYARGWSVGWLESAKNIFFSKTEEEDTHLPLSLSPIGGFWISAQLPMQ